jgi:hypothetical protein
MKSVWGVFQLRGWVRSLNPTEVFESLEGAEAFAAALRARGTEPGEDWRVYSRGATDWNLVRREG